MPLDLSQADSHDHCWMMDFYTEGCSADDIPTDATLVGVDDVINLTYDGTSKKLSIVMNKVWVRACLCLCLCVHECVCMYVTCSLSIYNLSYCTQIEKTFTDIPGEIHSVVVLRHKKKDTIANVCMH